MFVYMDVSILMENAFNVLKILNGISAFTNAKCKRATGAWGNPILNIISEVVTASKDIFKLKAAV